MGDLLFRLWRNNCSAPDEFDRCAVLPAAWSMFLQSNTACSFGDNKAFLPLTNSFLCLKNLDSVYKQTTETIRDNF